MDKFIELVNEVFTPDFNIKNCGRDKCIKLIEMCNKIDSSKDYGNIETGFMNIDAVVSLIISVMNLKEGRI